MSVLSRIHHADRLKPMMWPVSYGWVAPGWRWAWRGLVGFWPTWQQRPRDPFNRYSATGLRSSPTVVSTARGLGISFDGVNDAVTLTKDTTPSSAITYSLFLQAPDTAGGHDGDQWFVRRNDVNFFTASLKVNDDTVINVGGDLQVGGSSFTAFPSPTDPLDPSEIALCSITWRDGEAVRFYVNGDLRAETATASGTIDYDPDFAWEFGGSSVGTFGEFTLIAGFIYDRQLSRDELAVLARDPFGPFRMARRTWVAAATVGEPLSNDLLADLAFARGRLHFAGWLPRKT